MRNRLLLVATVAVLLGCSGGAADPAVEIKALERSKAGLLADLHSEREECRALGISLSAEPLEDRNRMVARCFETAKATAEPIMQTVRDLDKRIEDLRRAIR